MEEIFLKKVHENMIFSANILERWSFQKKKSQKHGLSCFVRKNDISFFQKYDLILLMENERLYF